MTSVDWIIVAFVVGVAAFGYAQGFIVGGLSLLGFLAGAFVGTRLAPLLLPSGAKSPYAPVFGLLGALVAGGILAMGLEGVGLALRRRVRLPVLGIVDGLLGALLTACAALGVAWIAGAVALQTPQARGLRSDIQRSVILRQLNATLPPSGPVLNALARFDPLPSINGPRADVAPPTAAIPREPHVRAASRSVVRILGTACGLGVEGSGWVAAPGIVVTNAHVIAGETDTKVEAGGSPPKLSAQALYFDPRNDIAVLRVAGLSRPALELAPGGGRPRAAVAVLGFPENGPFDARPARVGATQTVITDDAYGRGPVSRSVVSLRGRVRSGNSGGPLVDGAGRVQGTVFAKLTDRRQHGGLAVPNSIVARALSRASHRVGTGACTG